MKAFSIRQANFAKLFEQNLREPVLVKNSQGHQFLIMPLQGQRWQQILFHLYQLPEEVFEQNSSKKRNIEHIKTLCGSMKDYVSASDEFSRRKEDEKSMENHKWKK